MEKMIVAGIERCLCQLDSKKLGDVEARGAQASLFFLPQFSHV